MSRWPVRSLAERFWMKVERRGPDECWEWRAARNPEGYGWFNLGTGPTNAHRVAYELTVGPIPDGLTLDHLCRNRACVNPAHLEPVTRGENVLRGEGPSARQARQTHCKRGHPLSGGNLYVVQVGHRQCRACERMRVSARKATGLAAVSEARA